MIQDIAPHRLRNEFLPDARPAPGDRVFAFRERNLLVRPDDPDGLPVCADMPGGCPLTFAFRMDGNACWLCMDEQAALPEAFAPRPVRDFRGERVARHWAFAAWTAWQLYNWYRDNRFCGRCAAKTFPAPDERALVCPDCGRRIYPRIIPAVIVGVTNGDEILLTRYSGRDIPYYALIAGFTEIGETLEECVAREVMEEVGLKVTNLRYYKSQPWGIVDDLLAGFYCDVDGDPTIRLDRHELKEGVWVRRGDVTGQPDDFSLTNEMMMTFRDGREPK